MKSKILFTLLGLFALLMTIAMMVTVAAAADGYDLSWWTVDGGGGTSSGGDYTLSGTLGQPEAGAPLSAVEYTLTGGFWHGSTTPVAEMKIFLPLIVR